MVALVMWLVLRMEVVVLVPVQLQMVVPALIMIVVLTSGCVGVVLLGLMVLVLVRMRQLVRVVGMAPAWALVRPLRVVSLMAGLMVLEVTVLEVALVRMRWLVSVLGHLATMVMKVLMSTRLPPCPPQRPLRLPHCRPCLWFRCLPPWAHHFSPLLRPDQPWCSRHGPHQLLQQLLSPLGS